MQTTTAAELGVPARQILATLARTGEATITELVERLGVTTTAIRQQVNRLVADDWLVCHKRRGGPGRPADVFSLTDKARQWFGQSAERLCRLILEEMAGEIGPRQSQAILARVSRRMADDLRTAVADARESDSPDAGSVAALASALNEQGILAESEAGTRLTVFTCPFPDLAPDHPEICEIERSAVSELVGGAVKLECCRSNGQSRCDFVVKKPDADASESDAPVGIKVYEDGENSA